MPDNYEHPKSILNEYDGEINICNEITLYEINKEYDGKRPLVGYEWFLKKSTP